MIRAGQDSQRVVRVAACSQAASQAARFFSAMMLLSNSPNSASIGSRIRWRVGAGSYTINGRMNARYG